MEKIQAAKSAKHKSSKADQVGGESSESSDLDIDLDAYDFEPSVKGRVKDDIPDYLLGRDIDDFSARSLDEDELRELAEFTALDPEARADLIRKQAEENGEAANDPFNKSHTSFKSMRSNVTVNTINNDRQIKAMVRQELKADDDVDEYLEKLLEV